MAEPARPADDVAHADRLPYTIVCPNCGNVIRVAMVFPSRWALLRGETRQKVWDNCDCGRKLEFTFDFHVSDEQIAALREAYQGRHIIDGSGCGPVGRQSPADPHMGRFDRP